MSTHDLFMEERVGGRMIRAEYDLTLSKIFGHLMLPTCHASYSSYLLSPPNLNMGVVKKIYGKTNKQMVRQAS